MLNAADADEFQELAERRQDKIDSEGITGVQSNAELFAKWKETHSDVFDSGGVADGRGLLAKNIDSEEMVLGPEMTKMVLTPQSNEQFSTFTRDLADLFGMAKAGFTAGGVSTTDRHDVNYFINGVKIGQDMTQKPLSEVLSAITLYREQ